MIAMTYTIDGATAATGLPRTTIYELLGAGRLEGRKAGRRTLITSESIRQYLDSLPLANIRAPKVKEPT